MKRKPISEVYSDGALLLVCVAMRGGMIWLALMCGLTVVFGGNEAQFSDYLSWVNWSSVAWLPLCAGWEVRRIAKDALARDAFQRSLTPHDGAVSGMRR